MRLQQNDSYSQCTIFFRCMFRTELFALYDAMNRL